MRLLLLLGFLLLGQGAWAQTIVSEAVSFDSGSGLLHGTLQIPEHQRPLPLALLIAGSGPTDRNGNNPLGARNDGLRKLANALASRGIASFRYDKRGIAASQAAGADERQLSVERYVDDIVGLKQQLERDPRFSGVFLVGHSEGSLLASLAAAHTQVGGIVSIAGSSRPIGELLKEQLDGKLSPALYQRSLEIIDSLEQGQPVTRIPHALNSLFRPSVQPYLISLFRYPPAASFARLDVPTLIIQGTHDIQVDEQDGHRLQQATPHARLVLIKGMNHIFRIVPMDMQQQIASYNDPERPLAKQLPESIADFILATPSESQHPADE